MHNELYCNRIHYFTINCAYFGLAHVTKGDYTALKFAFMQYYIKIVTILISKYKSTLRNNHLSAINLSCKVFLTRKY